MNRDKIEIVAEIGQAHDGSLGIAHSYIDAATEIGVDTVKFQTHLSEAESSVEEKFRLNFSYEDKTRFDYWKRMEFDFKSWEGLYSHAKDNKLNFLSTPFCVEAVDLLESIGVDRFKVGSGDTSNFLMLDKIAKTGKPIILSSGMSTFKEIDATIEFLKEYDSEITIMQCTTSYPTNPRDWGLNVIEELYEKYNLPIGFSDHSGDIFSGLAAATLGVNVLEFHLVFDKNMFGPDSTSSLNIEQAKTLVRGVRQIEESKKYPIDKNNDNKFKKIKVIFGKSLSVNKDLHAGHILRIDDLESKKPGGFGIKSSSFKNVIGKKLNKNKEKWSFLNESDIE